MSYKMEVNILVYIIGSIIFSLILFFTLSNILKDNKRSILTNTISIRQNNANIEKNYSLLKLNIQMLATNTALLKKLKESSK